jgi:hypothetical protein
MGNSSSKIIVIEQKINWREVTRLASKKYGRQLSIPYCYNIYAGYRQSAKLLEIITDIIETAKKSMETENLTK